MTIRNQAVDPAQYDNGKISWEQETADSPMRKFFFEYLSKYREKFEGSSVLDVGCGTGWLLLKLSQLGASSVEGLEPSQVNYDMCRKICPGYTVHHTDLFSFAPQKSYD